MGWDMRIALFVPLDFDAWNYHRGLIDVLANRGDSVTVICPPGPYIVRLLRQCEVRHIPVAVNRFINPRDDLRLFWTLYGIFRRERFDIVHNNTIKPNIYGALAAKLAHSGAVYGAVRGRGAVFADTPDPRRKALRRVATNLYKLAFYFIDRVQFLNLDDLEFFVASGIIQRKKTTLIRSSGVNTRYFSREALSQQALERLKLELGISEGTLVVSMFARAHWTKGVREFIGAAKALSLNYPVKFLFVGKTEDAPDAVPIEYLQQQSQNFRWLGWRNDVRELMAVSDIVTLPSYYPEGIPRSLLEAMAMEKPIVTTDSVGCREVVEHGRNGFLVPTKNEQLLATAIETLLRDASLRESFGRYSRCKVEYEFSEDIIVQQVLEKLYQLKETWATTSEARTRPT
jgi:N,N'-diacetylbacillosaminyl-diphospho-undecaprenol alpha-1,3-N-acetylgalactosaminyltransferase